MAALLPQARDLEARQAPYTFCIRSTATYECPYYGPDGVLRRVRKQVTAHGTGFAFRQQDGGTFLLTNDHVAEWPPATDADHSVSSVAPGCRRVSDELRIVDSESDDYERDDVPLARVAVDPALDVAIVKARAALPVMPWKVGRSASLRERNAVNVRGFPLGIFKADNVGKVVSVYDHDDFRDWDHDDFVIDAQLSRGNSGSPVLAVSCRTGELELVGIYHASYSGGSGLNVVVAIDQVRDLMTTLQPSPRKTPTSQAVLDGAARGLLRSHVATSLDSLFPLGTLAAEVKARDDGRLVFELFARDFPERVIPLLVLEDLPATIAASFGSTGRAWVGNARGLKLLDRGALDAETQAGLIRILDALRSDALATFQYRALAVAAATSKERFREATRLHRSLERTTGSRQDIVDLAGDLADRLGPKAGEALLTATSGVLDPPAMAARAEPVSSSALTPRQEADGEVRTTQSADGP